MMRKPLFVDTLTVQFSISDLVSFHKLRMRSENLRSTLAVFNRSRFYSSLLIQEDFIGLAYTPFRL